MAKLNMTDVAEILAKLDELYPTFRSSTPKEVRVGIWYSELLCYSKEQIENAYRKVVRTSQYAPNIATFHAAIRDCEQLNEASGEDIWNIVMKAAPEYADLVNSFHYTYIEPGETLSQGDKAKEKANALWSSLPNEAKEFFSSEGGFRWYCTETYQKDRDIEKSRFIKNYDDIKSRVKSRGLALSNPSVAYCMLEE